MERESWEGGKAALFMPLIKGLSTVSAQRRETNLQADTLWRVCTRVGMSMHSHAHNFSPVSTSPDNLLQPYICSHMHVCTCTSPREHMDVTHIYLWSIVYTYIQGLQKHRLHTSSHARTGTLRQTSYEFEYRWASGWRLLQAVHLGESSPRFNLWHLETPQSLLIYHRHLKTEKETEGERERQTFRKKNEKESRES